MGFGGHGKMRESIFFSWAAWVEEQEGPGQTGLWLLSRDKFWEHGKSGEVKPRDGVEKVWKEWGSVGSQP